MKLSHAEEIAFHRRIHALLSAGRRLRSISKEIGIPAYHVARLARLSREELLREAKRQRLVREAVKKLVTAGIPMVEVASILGIEAHQVCVLSRAMALSRPKRRFQKCSPQTRRQVAKLRRWNDRPPAKRMTSGEAAKRLGVHRNRLYELAQSGGFQWTPKPTTPKKKKRPGRRVTLAAVKASRTRIEAAEKLGICHSALAGHLRSLGIQPPWTKPRLDWRAVMADAIAEDLTCMEVARKHHVDFGTVARRLRRMKIKLRNGRLGTAVKLPTKPVPMSKIAYARKIAAAEGRSFQAVYQKLCKATVGDISLFTGSRLRRRRDSAKLATTAGV